MRIEVVMSIINRAKNATLDCNAMAISVLRDSYVRPGGGTTFGGWVPFHCLPPCLG